MPRPGPSTPAPADDWFEDLPEIDASTTATLVDYVHHTWSVSVPAGYTRVAGRTPPGRTG